MSRVGGALAVRVGFVDDGAVADVFSQWHEEVCGWVGAQCEGLEGREGVHGAMGCCYEGVGWWCVALGMA